MTLFAEVILSLPLDKTFLYIVPEFLKDIVGVGSRVLVPFKERERTGIVIKLKKRGVSRDLKLKEIHAVLDKTPLLTTKFLGFTKKLSAHYYSSWGELIEASLPPSYVPKTRRTFSITDKGQESLDSAKLSDSERDVLLFLKERPYSDVYLKRKLKIRNLSSVFLHLVREGLIHEKKEVRSEIRRRQRLTIQAPTQLEMDFSLDKISYSAASRIVSGWDGRHFISYYLLGPADKREAVYFYLIKRTLALKKRILYLVPEIAATRSPVEKFRMRFGENATLLHSRMSARGREEAWSKIQSGQVDVVVGPRSAVLSPMENLGLVIVDEEQDESYFQRENPSYDARKGAHLRAQQERAVLLYGSSTPPVESYFQFKKTDRLLDIFEDSTLPHAEIVEHRADRGLLSVRLIERLGEALRQKNPVLIFHFRRGYASYVACSRCRYTPRCRECNIALSYHRRNERLVCHYCGHEEGKMSNCPECSHKIIVKKGMGVEAVEEEIRRRFPQSRVVGFDSDVAKRPKDRERLIDQFQKRKIDILVGTQLMAHQLELSKVSLAVVLYPEMILTLPDYRASQKAFQSIVQATKHLSPAENSEIWIQTAFPDHFSIRSAARLDYDGFYSQEIKFRRLMNYPPYTHMVEVLFQGVNLRSVARQSREFSSVLKENSKDVEVLGPALASLPRLRGKSRVQLIIKSKKKRALDKALKRSLHKVRANKKVILYY
ncbi:MAG: primosomal protein N' [Candidatus Aminicenantes bacterium]|jgi:primosomal protein N' (replication factor Y)